MRSGLPQPAARPRATRPWSTSTAADCCGIPIPMPSGCLAHAHRSPPRGGVRGPTANTLPAAFPLLTGLHQLKPHYIISGALELWGQPAPLCCPPKPCPHRQFMLLRLQVSNHIITSLKLLKQLVILRFNQLPGAVLFLPPLLQCGNFLRRKFAYNRHRMASFVLAIEDEAAIVPHISQPCK